MAETLVKDGLGNISTDTDKDFWIRREVLPDGKEYYYMVLVYVDHILCFHRDTLVVIDALKSIYVMNREAWYLQIVILEQTSRRCRLRTV